MTRYNLWCFTQLRSPKTAARRILVGLFSSVALALSGCSASTQTPVEEKASEREVIEELIRSLVKPSADVIVGLGTYVAPGSAAEQNILSVDSRLERGTTEGYLDRSTLEVTPILTRETDDGELAVDEITLCFEQREFEAIDLEDFCFLFSEFVVEDDVVVDFTLLGDPVHGQILLRYFNAILAGQPSAVLEAAKYVVPESPADLYITQQSQITQADVDTGAYNFYPYDVALEGGEILVDYSTRFSDFVFDDDRLVNFRAGDTFLDGRIFFYDEESVPIGHDASIRLLSAYYSSSGTLNLTLEIKAGEKVLYVPFRATYQPAEGRAMDFVTSAMPFELSGGRVSNAYWTFAAAPVGGELQLKFNDDQWNEISVSVPVPAQ